jgi:hypothetical protein
MTMYPTWLVPLRTLRALTMLKLVKTSLQNPLEEMAMTMTLGC